MSHSDPAIASNKRSLPRLVACLALCFLATATMSEAWAKSRVEVMEADFRLEQDVYQLDARIDLHLPKAAREAIEAGLTLRFDYELEITRDRRYWFDAGVAGLTQSYEISYHALSQRYLLRNLNTGVQQDFSSLQAALDRVVELRGLPVIDSALLEEGRRYGVRLRVVVDLSTVPDALRWLLFWTDEWSGVSEWYTWTIQP